MIKNDWQYRITRSKAGKLALALEQLEQVSPLRTDLHPLLQKAQIDGLRSQLDDLRAELKSYETLKFGDVKTLPLTSLDDLPIIMIQARIALGLTQKELAEQLGVAEQQVQRYEETEYQGASFASIARVARVLGLSVVDNVHISYRRAEPEEPLQANARTVRSRLPS
ncbi:MAG TPA: helix-turn-helix transcriptional regulator [Chloroflexia bacterium]|jgi:DNA-binding XRE family transcriptional regulator